MKRAPFFLVLLVVFAACAGHKAGRTKLADGSYQLACRTPLADCLGDLTDVCSAHGYDIVRAQESRRRTGVEPVDSEFIESEAIVRCRAASTIFGSSPSPAASSSAPVVTGAAQRCFPGATQSCLGPAACQGAQICTSDGSMFGPCDCGVRATPLAGASEADAGPPTTWAVPTGDGGAP